MPLKGFRLLLIGTCLLFPSSLFAQQYTVTDVGRLPGAYGSIPSAINAAGQVVGRSDSGGGPEWWHAFLWTQGTMQDLGLLPGMNQCIATAINDRVEVVGYCYAPSAQAFVWTADAGMTAIGPDGSRAFGINNNGDVVGDYTSGADGGTHAFLIRDGEFRDLGLGIANGINDNGWIVGWAERHAALWDEDGEHDLGSVEGESGFSTAYAVSVDGLIAGVSQVGEWYQYHAVLWTPYGIADLGALRTGRAAGALAISRDLIVGSSTTTPQGDSSGFLYDNNGPGYPVALNDLIPADSGWSLTAGTGVNAAKQIVGYGAIQGQLGFRAFLLTPVQSP